MILKMTLTLLMLSFLCVPFVALAKGESAADEPNNLLVVWTSGDKDVAVKMVFMYTYNAKKNGWWEGIKLLVWGPSAKLLSEDKELQDYVRKMKEEGVDVIACKACADSYGVSEKLEAMGINVFFVGQNFTKMLKSDWKTVTF
jgi:hypothetical protein